MKRLLVTSIILLLTSVSVVHGEEVPGYSIPPLSEDQMDLLIDSLRSQRPLDLPPLHTSGQVDPLIQGIWAGSITDTQSTTGPITLRFRRRLDSLVSQDNQLRVQANDLLESFDISLEQQKRFLIIRHSHASQPKEQAGISLLMTRPTMGTQVVALRGARESGIYVGLSPLVDVETAWAVLLCPRVFGRDHRGKNGFQVFDLTPSPYELSEVNMSFAMQAAVSMSTAGRLGRARIGAQVTEMLPKAEQEYDEGISAAPKARYTYRPSTPFDFFRFAPYTSTQQGTLLQVQMQNRKGWLRTENFSNAIYVQKLSESSPVTPVVSGRGVERNEGECYVVVRHRYSWREYTQESEPAWAKEQNQ
jgi:hypothetical protein